MILYAGGNVRGFLHARGRCTKAADRFRILEIEAVRRMLIAVLSGKSG